ncbi:DUF2505 domain-containing protein [Saccharopolyspora rosea]|uniref:DUF2505 domain-containing protein n=1 Tax=Saccharopolyspora rosea TaxID=524884 RepID=A0ABW3FIS2_9PSEU|nr:DUF2505 domain-containing protein [Saccharopolyspora rosea]
MARRIEHRSTSEWAAAQVYAALVDVDFLIDRLNELGGASSALVSHEETDDGVRFQVRHGVPSDELPAVARTVVGSDLTIDRSESWRQAEEGHYSGEVAAEISGAPCSITGSMWLRDLGDPDTSAVSEFVVSGAVRVSLPFLGGKLEDIVADQVQKLLVAEEHFMTEWLARHA